MSSRVFVLLCALQGEAEEWEGRVELAFLLEQLLREELHAECEGCEAVHREDSFADFTEG